MSSPLIHCLRLLWVKKEKPHHIQPHSRWRWTHVHCFSFSRDSFTSRLVSPLPPPKSCPVAEPSHWGKTRLSCSCRCFFFFFIPSVHCSQKRTQTEVTGPGRVEETWTLVVHCKYELLLPFSWPVGSVSVFIIDSNVYMNHWLSGTWRKLLEYDAIETCHSFYLWWLPLFYLFCFLLCFDIA